VWDARRDDRWTFVSLPAAASDEIRELANGPRRGFGSLRVQVTVGAARGRRRSSRTARGGYVLPIKRAIRKAEALDARDIATMTVAVIEL
jgi:hypothetical protein